MNHSEAITYSTLLKHRSIVVLTEGYSNPQYAKTAMALLRYRRRDLAAVLDSTVVSKNAHQLLNCESCTTESAVPVIASLQQAQNADALYLGIAPPGGRLPVEWKSIILQAIRMQMDIVSGLHDFLSDDPDLCSAAAESGTQLVDVRRTEFQETAKGLAQDLPGLRIHTVGQDCSVGKMATAMEVHLGLQDRGMDSAFVATGQTGIMISGNGIPIDRVIGDFVNGAAEKLVTSEPDRQFLLVEGQGSISHPAYSAVTLGLLHGCAPQALIFCLEADRQSVKGLPQLELPPVRQQMETLMAAARLRFPCKFIGVAVNTRNLDPKQAHVSIEQIEKDLGLPTCDVYRDGADKLVDACLALREEMNANDHEPA